jgi:hypothetical protein
VLCLEGVTDVARMSLMSKDDVLSADPPELALTYGQVMWLLLRLGYGKGVTQSTFHEYLKSLRKLGIPFGGRVSRPGERTRARYSYYHIMELALVQCLRIYHVVPDSILREIGKHRDKMGELYRRAYASRASGEGASATFGAKGTKPIELRGLFLDLNIKFSGGQMINFGPPRLLSPTDTIVRFAKCSQAGEVYLPINLSRLAEDVVMLALSPPSKRRKAPLPPVRFPDAPRLTAIRQKR